MQMKYLSKSWRDPFYLYINPLIIFCYPLSIFTSHGNVKHPSSIKRSCMKPHFIIFQYPSLLLFLSEIMTIGHTSCYPMTTNWYVNRVSRSVSFTWLDVFPNLYIFVWYYMSIITLTFCTYRNSSHGVCNMSLWFRPSDWENDNPCYGYCKLWYTKSVMESLRVAVSCLCVPYVHCKNCYH